MHGSSHFYASATDLLTLQVEAAYYAKASAALHKQGPTYGGELVSTGVYDACGGVSSSEAS